MADHIDGMAVHLAHRDVTFVAISRAPFAEIDRFRRRMGWRFEWLSSHGNSFNYDFRVSFTPEEVAKGELPYNYGSGLMRSRNGPASACSGRTMRAMSFTPIRPMDVVWR